MGVDLIIIETMVAMDEAEQAIAAAKLVAPHIPVFAMVTVDEDAACLDGSSPETAAMRMTRAGADVIGCNCSLGPATILTAIEAMRAATSLPLVVMPNAGMPREVDGRNIYLTSPEYMASFAKRFVQGRRAVRRRVLRDDAKPHSRDEVGDTRDGRATCRHRSACACRDCFRSEACSTR